MKKQQKQIDTAITNDTIKKCEAGTASQYGEDRLVHSDTNVQRVINDGLKAALQRAPVSGDNWMFQPDLVPLAEERLESRFDNHLPVLQHLDTALALANMGELASLASNLRAALPAVRWSQNPSYTLENTSQTFLDGYAYAGLAGPDCPVRCEVPRLGFVLMGPGVEYKNHQHEPREFYLVLTSGSQWKLDDKQWFDVNPGDLILHDPWQMHAMRTDDQPLLAFAGWLEAGDRCAITI